MLDSALLLDLLSRTARGDSDAFQQLYNQTAPKLLGLAMFIVKNKPSAEEILQESYIKIWNNAGEYHQERGSVMTWMSTIVRYSAIDMLRKQNRQVQREDSLVPVLENSAESYEYHFEQWQEQELLQGCLEELTSIQKQSISMAFLEGLTHSELAESLKAPLGSVKSWIRRGLISLRRCLEQ